VENAQREIDLLENQIESLVTENNQFKDSLMAIYRDQRKTIEQLEYIAKRLGLPLPRDEK
jgi:hypothetical protein